MLDWATSGITSVSRARGKAVQPVHQPEIHLPPRAGGLLCLHSTQLPGRPSHPLKQISNLGTDFKLETRRSKIFKFHLLILLSEISQRGWKVKLVFPAEQSRALFEAGNLLDDKLLVAPPKVRQCVS